MSACLAWVAPRSSSPCCSSWRASGRCTPTASDSSAPYIGDWASHLDVTPGQAFLLDQPGADLDRVLTFGEDANRMGAVGLVSADGDQAIYPVAYHDFFGAVIRPQLDIDPASATYFDKWGNRAITFGPNVDPELVALVGARWLYVRGDEVPTVPDAVERFRDEAGDVTVYEVPSSFPRAFLAGGVRVEPNPGAVVSALAVADLATLRGTAFVADGRDADVLESVPRADGSVAAGDATIVSMTPDRVEVEVRASGPAVLVLTDVMAPGWIAERDGVRVPIATVDRAFRGVAVDGSTSRVVLWYGPGFTVVGFMGAGAALLGALALAWFVRRADGRRLAPSSTLSPAPPGIGGDSLEDR